ncbi:MAG TPA: triose-phosphate isomerase, partial [Terricaulis sp.]|nr:triose-phosphate isomerase [Terricaulis sp.]
MAARKPLIAGNWKMYGRRAALAEAVALQVAAGEALGRVEALICPPAVYVAAAAQALAGHVVTIGAQDCSPSAEDAARTGEVSAAMLADAGAAYVIVGHSERRAIHQESDDLVRQKAEAAQAAGLAPIVCVGETEAERNAGAAASVVAAQVRASTPAQAAALVVAYEPVWAIGTGLTPTKADVADMHKAMRETLAGR